MHDWPSLIREIPDFPRAGIAFKDITPLLADADGFNAAVEAMAMPWRGIALDAVFAIESRGFILGAALARRQGALVVGASVLVEIAALDGRARWDPELPLEIAVRY